VRAGAAVAKPSLTTTKTSKAPPGHMVSATVIKPPPPPASRRLKQAKSYAEALADAERDVPIEADSLVEEHFDEDLFFRTDPQSSSAGVVRGTKHVSFEPGLEAAAAASTSMGPPPARAATSKRTTTGPKRRKGLMFVPPSSQGMEAIDIDTKIAAVFPYWEFYETLSTLTFDEADQFYNIVPVYGANSKSYQLFDINGNLLDGEVWSASGGLDPTGYGLVKAKLKEGDSWNQGSRPFTAIRGKIDQNHRAGTVFHKGMETPDGEPFSMDLQQTFAFNPNIEIEVNYVRNHVLEPDAIVDREFRATSNAMIYAGCIDLVARDKELREYIIDFKRSEGMWEELLPYSQQMKELPSGMFRPGFTNVAMYNRVNFPASVRKYLMQIGYYRALRMIKTRNYLASRYAILLVVRPKQEYAPGEIPQVFAIVFDLFRPVYLWDRLHTVTYAVHDTLMRNLINKTLALGKLRYSSAAEALQAVNTFNANYGHLLQDLLEEDPEEIEDEARRDLLGILLKVFTQELK
jgi:hypothetical protein